MGTVAAPRIDDRLRRFIAGSPEPAAEVTRLVGALAEELCLSRPSYEQVRVLLNAARSSNGVRLMRLPRQVDVPRRPLRVVDVLDFLYDYPGPGLGAWYERYKRGM